MPTRPPRRREAGVAHPPDPAHHRIEIGHFERDVVERGKARARERDRMMRGVAAHEHHARGPVRHRETEQVFGNLSRVFGVARVEHDMRELDRGIARRKGRDFAATVQKAEPLTIGKRDEHAAPAARIGAVDRRAADRRHRATAGDIVDRPGIGHESRARERCGIRLAQRDQIGEGAGSASVECARRIARVERAPHARQKRRGLRGIRDIEFDAAKIHD